MEPYMRAVTGPVSTPLKRSAIRVRPSSRQGAQRRKAAPLGASAKGRRTVTLNLKHRGGAEGWIEVRIGGRSERFFVKHTDWIGDVFKKICEGDYWVEPIQ